MHLSLSGALALCAVAMVVALLMLAKPTDPRIDAINRCTNAGGVLLTIDGKDHCIRRDVFIPTTRKTT